MGWLRELVTHYSIARGPTPAVGAGETDFGRSCGASVAHSRGPPGLRSSSKAANFGQARQSAGGATAVPPRSAPERLTLGPRSAPATLTLAISSAPHPIRIPKDPTAPRMRRLPGTTRFRHPIRRHSSAQRGRAGLPLALRRSVEVGRSSWARTARALQLVLRLGRDRAPAHRGPVSRRRCASCRLAGNGFAAMLAVLRVSWCRPATVLEIETKNVHPAGHPENSDSKLLPAFTANVHGS